MARIPGLLLIAGCLSLAGTVEADVYKCQDASGKIAFSDRPCSGTRASPEARIDVVPQNIVFSPAREAQLRRQQHWSEDDADPSPIPRAPGAGPRCREFSNFNLQQMLIRHQVVPGMTFDTAMESWGQPSRGYGLQFIYEWRNGTRSSYVIERGCVVSVQGSYGG